MKPFEVVTVRPSSRLPQHGAASTSPFTATAIATSSNANNNPSLYQGGCSSNVNVKSSSYSGVDDDLNDDGGGGNVALRFPSSVVRPHSQHPQLHPQQQQHYHPLLNGPHPPPTALSATTTGGMAVLRQQLLGTASQLTPNTKRTPVAISKHSVSRNGRPVPLHTLQLSTGWEGDGGPSATTVGESSYGAISNNNNNSAALPSNGGGTMPSNSPLRFMNPKLRNTSPVRSNMSRSPPRPLRNTELITASLPKQQQQQSAVGGIDMQEIERLLGRTDPRLLLKNKKQQSEGDAEGERAALGIKEEEEHGLLIEDLIPTHVVPLDLRKLPLDFDVSEVLPENLATRTPRLEFTCNPAEAVANTAHEMLRFPNFIRQQDDPVEPSVDRCLTYFCKADEELLFDALPEIDAFGTLTFACKQVNAVTTVSVFAEDCSMILLKPTENHHGKGEPLLKKSKKLTFKIQMNCAAAAGIGVLAAYMKGGLLSGRQSPSRKRPLTVTTTVAAAAPKQHQSQSRPEPDLGIATQNHHTQLVPHSDQQDAAPLIVDYYRTGPQASSSSDKYASPSDANNSNNSSSGGGGVRTVPSPFTLHTKTSIHELRAGRDQVVFLTPCTQIEALRCLFILRERESLSQTNDPLGVGVMVVSHGSLSASVDGSPKANTKTPEARQQAVQTASESLKNAEAKADIIKVCSALMRLAQAHADLGAPGHQKALETLRRLCEVRLKRLEIEAADGSIASDLDTPIPSRSPIGLLDERYISEVDNLANIFFTTGVFLKTIGRYSEAMKYFVRSRDATIATRGLESVGVIRCLTQVGEILSHVGDYVESKKHLEGALMAGEMVWGPQSSNNHPVRLMLGLTYAQMGEYREGCRMLEDVFRQRAKEGEESNSAIVVDGDVLSLSLNSDSAAAGGAGTVKKQSAKGHLSVAEVLMYLAEVHLIYGKWKQAEQCASDAAEHYRSVGGDADKEIRVPESLALAIVAKAALGLLDYTKAERTMLVAYEMIVEARGEKAVESCSLRAQWLEMYALSSLAAGAAARKNVTHPVYTKVLDGLQQVHSALMHLIGPYHPHTHRVGLVMAQLILLTAHGDYEAYAKDKKLAMQLAEASFQELHQVLKGTMDADVLEAFGKFHCAVDFSPSDETGARAVSLLNAAIVARINTPCLTRKKNLMIRSVCEAYSRHRCRYWEVHKGWKTDSHSVLEPPDLLLQQADDLSREIQNNLNVDGPATEAELSHLVESLQNVGELYYLKGQPQRAHHYLGKALKVSDRHNMIFLLGNLFRPSAQLSLSEVNERNRIVTDRVAPTLAALFAGILFSIGAVYEGENKLADAEASFVQTTAALEIAGLQYSIGMSQTYRTLGRLLYIQGLYGDSLAYFEKAYNALVEHNPHAKGVIQAAHEELEAINIRLRLVGYSLQRHTDGKFRFAVYL